MTQMDMNTLLIAFMAMLTPLSVAVLNNLQAKKTQERVWEHDKQVTGKLDEIHELVNSNLTMSVAGQLASEEGHLSAWIHVLSLERHQGGETSESLSEVQRAKRKVEELKAELSERIIQADKAEKLMEKQA
jgi:hypothetical protein